MFSRLRNTVKRRETNYLSEKVESLEQQVIKLESQSSNDQDMLETVRGEVRVLQINSLPKVVLNTLKDTFFSVLGGNMLYRNREFTRSSNGRVYVIFGNKTIGEVSPGSVVVEKDEYGAVTKLKVHTSDVLKIFEGTEVQDFLDSREEVEEC